MPLKMIPKTCRMGKEDRQLEEMLQKISEVAKGETVLFPEYGAYTLEGSRKAFAELSKVAASKDVTVITSLNLPSEDLPHANPNAHYNAIFIFSRKGQVYSPQAKITPQSFEMRHLDESFPKMEVTPYSWLNRVTLNQNGETFDAFFFICSDLYVLPLFDPEQLKAEAIVCPANFGNGAEGAAEKVIVYAIKSGLFKRGFYANTGQSVKSGMTPLTIAVEKVLTPEKALIYKKGDMEEIVKKSSVVYPDEEYLNFKSMLKLTQNGTFTVPRSRSAGNGLKIRLGAYEKVVEL